MLRLGVTVVRQPGELLGRIAAEVLFERLSEVRRPKAGNHIVFPVGLVGRGSCAVELAVRHHESVIARRVLRVPVVARNYFALLSDKQQRRMPRLK